MKNRTFVPIFRFSFILFIDIFSEYSIIFKNTFTTFFTF